MKETLLYPEWVSAGSVDTPGGCVNTTQWTQQQNADCQSPDQQEETSW